MGPSVSGHSEQKDLFAQFRACLRRAHIAMGAKHSQPGYDYKAKKLTKNQYKEIRKSFAQVASGAVGITKEKWIEVAQQAGVSDPELAAATFDGFDIDGNGFLDEQEFLDMSALVLAGTPEEQLRASFNYFDKDRNGILTKEELRLKLRSMVVHKFQTRNQALSGALKDDLYQVIDHVLDDVFQKADSDGDGGISIEEYVKAFSGESEATDFLKHM